MKIRSAALYAAATFVAGVLGELWRMRDPRYSAALGLEGAVIGLALFALLFAFLIYTYGLISQAVRREALVQASLWSIVAGLPAWPILFPLHELLRDELGLPDALWWIEMALVGIISFELIRRADRWSGRAQSATSL